MKLTILILVFLGIVYTADSQDRKSARKAKKETELTQRTLDFNLLGEAIDSRSFILELENLISSTLNRKLNPMTNVIIVTSKDCVWQCDGAYIPTDLFKSVSMVEGTISGWKLEKDEKHKQYNLEFKMFTDNGLFHVNLYMFPDKTFSGSIVAVRDRFDIYGRLIKKTAIMNKGPH